MMPRLSEKCDIEIETISKTIAEYNTDENYELDLPVAPAVIIGEGLILFIISIFFLSFSAVLEPR